MSSRRRRRFRISPTAGIPLLAGLTLALGIWAWMDQKYDFWDAVYRAVSLFDLGNDLYNGSGIVDWRFQVGRWTGLLTVFGAALLALGAILQDRVARGAARWMTQQVVIVGGEGLATKAFDMVRGAGRSVTWIGASSVGPGVFRSIALPWPPDDHAATVRTHAQGAQHILIAMDDDADALILVRAAREGAPAAFITALMRDARLAEDAAATLNQARTRLLSVAAVSARALHNAHPPFLVAQRHGSARIHALIVGFGQTGQAIARDLIVNCRTAFLAAPRITVIDPNAERIEAVIRLRAPEIDHCAEFAFIRGEIASESLTPPARDLGPLIARGGPLTNAYICLHHDAAALTAAAMLQSLMRDTELGAPSIFVRLRDAATVGSGVVDPDGLDLVTPFGDLDAVLAASEFLSTAPDQAARAFSAAYRAALPDEQRNDPENVSARDWEALDETYRQANRDAVAHIGAKMASAGIDPALWKGVHGVPRLPRGLALFNTEEECERLARLEHDRWNAQRRMDGWRWSETGAKDEARRRHQSLLPYDDLTDEVKEYDRVYIRETAAACRAR